MKKTIARILTLLHFVAATLLYTIACFGLASVRGTVDLIVWIVIIGGAVTMSAGITCVFAQLGQWGKNG